MARGDLGRDDGAALVEAAMLLPVLLGLCLVLVEVSLYFWSAALADKAVAIGLRRAVISAPVAVGPGLEPADSDTYWDGLPPGASCDAGLCPAFAVECRISTGCRCAGTACRFAFAPARMDPILDAMRAVLPRIGRDNLVVGYKSLPAGWVGRPPPVPVVVSITLTGWTYRPVFLGDVAGRPFAIAASGTLAGEALGFAR